MKQALRTRLGHDWFEADLPEPFETEDQTWDIMLPVAGRRDFVEIADLGLWVLRRSQAEVERLFREAAAEWTADTAVDGNAVAMVLHPAYQRIIGLGPQALPLIIEALRVEVDHWFWALRAIVGRDIAEGATSLPEAARRWIDWYDREHA